VTTASRSGIVNHRDGVDGKQEPAGELDDGRRAHRRRVRKVLGEERVECRKRRRVGDEARDLDDPLEATPGVFEHGREVDERLARLRLERAAGDGAAGRIDPRLPCRIHEIADTNRLRVRPDAGDARAFDDFRGQSHAGFLGVWDGHPLRPTRKPPKGGLSVLQFASGPAAWEFALFLSTTRDAAAVRCASSTREPTRSEWPPTTQMAGQFEPW